ncbi:MAG: hypothetical protein KGL39_49090 [Patescibacteria group bacterium]|nr:hypothetical protein [Patescibacteria group bacterium]
MKYHLRRVPISQDEALRFVNDYHRHNEPPEGWKFGGAVAAQNPSDGTWAICGVVIVGRPVSRVLDCDDFTCEITRCCTDGTPNAPTMLYRMAVQAARSLGYQNVITYTLAHETGTSLKACGFKPRYLTKGGTWNRRSRPRVDVAPPGQKRLWSIA